MDLAARDLEKDRKGARRFLLTLLPATVGDRDAVNCLSSFVRM